jgi:formylmethanofuran dehydrogenase subunit E
LNDYEYFMEKANEFHGHICTGIALGIRMSLAAMRHLGLDPRQKNKDIIVYAEIDRCMTDAVMVVTGCSLGRRTLKHVDYGKFAMTLVNMTTGRAVRATSKHIHKGPEPMEEILKKIDATPDAELVSLQEVKLKVPESDLPGPPTRTAVCSACGERIMDGRDCPFEGQVMCRGCLNGTYYSTEV